MELSSADLSLALLSPSFIFYDDHQVLLSHSKACSIILLGVCLIYHLDNKETQYGTDVTGCTRLCSEIVAKCDQANSVTSMTASHISTDSV